MGKKQYVTLQQIEKPFEVELHKDLTKLCRKIGASYDYLKQVEMPIVYQKKFVINRVVVEE
jgi:hypothetical protein